MSPQTTYAKGILFVAIMAAGGMAWLIFAHLTEMQWAFFFIMEGAFCYVAIPGILGLDYYARINGLSGVRGEWDPIITFWHFGMIVLVVLCIQKFITQLGAILSVSQVELFFYYIFGAICEELFFRGFVFRILLGNKNNYIRLIAGTIVSTVGFVLIHVSYYNSSLKLAIVAVSGAILCVLYWWWKDLLANVVAHAFINLIVAITLVAFFVI
jgi:membrane protease YdiL (CAAX protease family)